VLILSALMSFTIKTSKTHNGFPALLLANFFHNIALEFPLILKNQI